MAQGILVVDDEKEIADLLEIYLKNEGFIVYKCYDGKSALDCIAQKQISLAVLDVMLPDVSGFTICKQIREKHFYPVIMLTAKVEDLDKITGLTMGADDYITKPFNPIEVVARVKSQLRRYLQYNKEAVDSQEVLKDADTQEYDVRGLRINAATHKCMLFEEEIGLTPREFDILWFLFEKKGQVVTSEELFEHVWGERYIDDNNTVMVHIGRLREKLHENGRKPKFIKTVWGVGYQIEN